MSDAAMLVQAIVVEAGLLGAAIGLAVLATIVTIKNIRWIREAG